MKVLNDKVEDRQVFLTIEMEPAEVEKALEEAYVRLVNKVSIPGFRQGKAPRTVLEQHIGKDGLLDDALSDLLPKACDKTIKERQIEALARPVISITQTEPVVLFEATVPLLPQVKLGNYQRIRIKPERVKLGNNEVNAVVEQLRQQRATFEPVERPVKAKDSLVLDISSNIENKPFITEAGVPYQVIFDTDFPAPGFAKQLLGMKRGKEKEFKLRLADDYFEKEQAGKEVLFKVKITEIKENKLPELNDDFAKGLAADIETIDSLRERIAADLKLKAEEKAMTEHEERVIDAVVKLSEVKFPPILVDVEVDRMTSQELQYWQRAAKSREEYLGRLKETPEKELQDKFRPAATKRVIVSLVLDKIIETEKVEATDAEVDAKIERMTENAGEKKEAQQKLLNNLQPRERIKQMLTTEKAVRRLVEIAKGLSKKTKGSDKKAKESVKKTKESSKKTTKAKKEAK